MIIALNHMKCDFLLKLLGNIRLEAAGVTTPVYEAENLPWSGWVSSAHSLRARLMDTPRVSVPTLCQPLPVLKPHTVCGVLACYCSLIQHQLPKVY